MLVFFSSTDMLPPNFHGQRTRQRPRCRHQRPQFADGLEAVAGAVRARRKGYICVTGVHGVMEAQTDENFRRILNGAFLCTPDGMPMVWMGKLHGHREMHRVYGPDLMLDVCAWSETNPCRHFFYGGADGVAELLGEKLKARFPKLQIVGRSRHRSAR